MHKDLGFLKVSSAMVKIAAWIFLFLGLLGGVSLLFGVVPGTPRWMGIIILGFYVFIFLFLFFTAKIAELLVKVINAIKLE